MRWRAHVVASLALAIPAMARGQTATQTVTFEVQAINQISVSGNPAILSITTATAGSAPNSVTVGGTTYAITTNQSTKKITAALDANMPSGLTLSATLAAPSGASAAQRSLSTSAADVVTNITKLNASALAISYQLDATSAAGVVTSTTRTVTFTIVDGP